MFGPSAPLFFLLVLQRPTAAAAFPRPQVPTTEINYPNHAPFALKPVQATLLFFYATNQRANTHHSTKRFTPAAPCGMHPHLLDRILLLLDSSTATAAAACPGGSLRHPQVTSSKISLWRLQPLAPRLEGRWGHPTAGTAQVIKMKFGQSQTTATKQMEQDDLLLEDDADPTRLQEIANEVLQLERTLQTLSSKLPHKACSMHRVCRRGPFVPSTLYQGGAYSLQQQQPQSNGFAYHNNLLLRPTHSSGITLLLWIAEFTSIRAQYATTATTAISSTICILLSNVFCFFFDDDEWVWRRK